MSDTQHEHRDVVASVHNFNRIGQTMPPDGTFNGDRIGFYTGMQCEELSEKLVAIAYGALTESQRNHIMSFAHGLQMLGKEFKSGQHYGNIMRSDREGLLDGDIDVVVVTLGSMSYQTPHYRKAIDKVLDANDAKMPGGVVTHDANGKIVKPAGWVAPDLSPFILQPVS